MISGYSFHSYILISINNELFFYVANRTFAKAVVSKLAANRKNF